MDTYKLLSNAVKAIKDAILKSQLQAASIVNKEMLSLYFGIGAYVSNNSRNGFWGKGAIEIISKRLQEDLPGLRGFSAANIKFMRQFYEAWSPIINRQPMADDNKTLTAVSENAIDNSLTAVSEINTKLLTHKGNGVLNDFSMDTFLSLGFTHHIIIIRKTEYIPPSRFRIRV